MSLKVHEIFTSIQGEARFVGNLTTFIRLTGCPLRCTYCDTPHAFSQGEQLSYQAIFSQIKVPYVTVTGGEPLAQKNCYPLLTQLCDQDFSVSLETGGMLSIKEVDPRVHIVLDLKTPGSGMEEYNDFSNIPLLQAKDMVKFVITDRSDYEWAKQILQEHKIGCEVFFSPCRPQQSPTELAEWMIKDLIPARLQVQLHQVLWPGEIGR